MSRRTSLIHALLLLLLLTQYAAVTHAAGHHLLDTPLQAETDQCDGFHLQQPHAQPLQMDGFSGDTATIELTPARVPVAPCRQPDTGFHCRAPPVPSPA